MEVVGIAMSAVRELSGTTLKGYQLENCLGWSSHTAVYDAWRGGASWAVKIVDGDLAPDAALADRLKRDARVLADLDHPGIVPIHDAGRTGRLTYAVSPLVRARRLDDLMRGRQLNGEQAWGILSSLADALDRVHERGPVCRLLRPSHVFVQDGKVRLAEFGVASDRVGRLAMSTPAYHVTAPQYLAPEQLAGREPDSRTDVYALAVLVFEILTRTELQGGRTPLEAMRATLDGGPPSAAQRQPDLPSGIDLVLGRALARDPALRQRSAGELMEQLVTLPDERAHRVERAVRSIPALPAPAPATPLSPAKVPTPASSMVAVLKRLGVPALRGRETVILDAYFAELLRQAKRACEGRWPNVVAAADVDARLAEVPVDGAGRTTPVAAVSRLADAIEAVFDLDSSEVLRQWGRLAMESWARRTWRRPHRLWSSGERRVEDVVTMFTRDLDLVRGERLTGWKKVDGQHFWVVCYDNLGAVGRRRPGRSCHLWTGALEQALRWGGVANRWVVDEAECGCVTGTYDCVFTIQFTDL
jgi:Protein kinase domain